MVDHVSVFMWPEGCKNRGWTETNPVDLNYWELQHWVIPEDIYPKEGIV